MKAQGNRESADWIRGLSGVLATIFVTVVPVARANFVVDVATPHGVTKIEVPAELKGNCHSELALAGTASDAFATIESFAPTAREGQYVAQVSFQVGAMAYHLRSGKELVSLRHRADGAVLMGFTMAGRYPELQVPGREVFELSGDLKRVDGKLTYTPQVSVPVAVYGAPLEKRNDSNVYHCSLREP